jgi:hypothetical protein
MLILVLPAPFLIALGAVLLVLLGIGAPLLFMTAQTAPDMMRKGKEAARGRTEKAESSVSQEGGKTSQGHDYLVKEKGGGEKEKRRKKGRLPSSNVRGSQGVLHRCVALY